MVKYPIQIKVPQVFNRILTLKVYCAVTKTEKNHSI